MVLFSTLCDARKEVIRLAGAGYEYTWYKNIPDIRTIFCKTSNEYDGYWCRTTEFSLQIDESTFPGNEVL